jgi:hypothetical protein
MRAAGEAQGVTPLVREKLNGPAKLVKIASNHEVGLL